MERLVDRDPILFDLSEYRTFRAKRARLEIDPFAPHAEQDSVRIVPLGAMAQSPRANDPIQSTFPRYPRARSYIEPRDKHFDDIVDHIDASLTLLRKMSPTAYEGYRSSIHTVFVTIQRDGS